MSRGSVTLEKVLLQLSGSTKCDQVVPSTQQECIFLPDMLPRPHSACLILRGSGGFLLYRSDFQTRRLKIPRQLSWPPSEGLTQS